MMNNILNGWIVLQIITVAFFFGVQEVKAQQHAKTKRPNIVFFLVDDMGWKDMGAFGSELYETPNMDKLCGDGVRFTNAYTSAPICSPARASVLSGRHPLSLRMWHAPHYIRKEDSKQLLPRLLKDVGYSTWHVGKWHLGNPEDKTMPTDVGFDINIGGAISWDPGSYFWPYKCDEKGKSVGHPRAFVPLRKGGKQGEQITDRLTDEALKLINNKKSAEPFYLNMWYYSVHNALGKKQAKPELIHKYKKKIKDLGLKETYRTYLGDSLLTSETNATYAAMLETVDNSVGRIVNALKKKGLYENTLFVFYSDNGPTTNDVPCDPLWGGKNTTYEAGVRMPAFITWNGNIKGNKKSKERIIIMDVFNTILDAALVDLPLEYRGDGISLLPLLKEGESVPKRNFYWFFPDNRRKWGGRSSAAMMNKEGWKYIYFFTGDEPELYNINDDMEELHNELQKYPGKASKLGNKLAEFLAKNGYSKMKMGRSKKNNN
ncbi:hypothetical protein EMN47_03235 [Prolixibacteraceae bacterium JC049]|nr:hypothetical protein [Prolixibacteraceae bacterium JC049]